MASPKCRGGGGGGKRPPFPWCQVGLKGDCQRPPRAQNHPPTYPFPHTDTPTGHLHIPWTHTHTPQHTHAHTDHRQSKAQRHGSFLSQVAQQFHSLKKSDPSYYISYFILSPPSYLTPHKRASRYSHQEIVTPYSAAAAFFISKALPKLFLLSSVLTLTLTPLHPFMPGSKAASSRKPARVLSQNQPTAVCLYFDFQPVCPPAFV